MFSDAEDVILDALRSSAPAYATGADLAAAMRASPYKETETGPSRERMPLRDAPARRLLLMAWLLDTNVLSELRRPDPNPGSWLLSPPNPLEQLYVSVVTQTVHSTDMELHLMPETEAPHNV